MLTTSEPFDPMFAKGAENPLPDRGQNVPVRLTARWPRFSATAWTR